MVKSKYKIRLVHLLLSDDSDPYRQEKSIEQLKELAVRGIEYVQVWNKRWKENPPRENFARPAMFDQVPINKAHYGCFRAFADGALDNFEKDVDALILCEGDVRLIDSPDQVVDKINRAYEATQSLGIDYFSLGSKYTLEGNILQSDTLEKYGDVEITNKIIGIQMILFPQRIREYLLDCYINSPWDGADIFLNQNFMGKKKIGIFSESPTGQWDGISTIEGRERKFTNTSKKLMYIAPHLSTGGMPQFLLKRVESLINEPNFEIYVVEFNNYSDDFVVQKDKLKNLLGDRLMLIKTGLSIEHREERLLGIIDSIKPDIIHIEECPESFDGGNKMSHNTLNKIYRQDRPYQIVETCHNIWMNDDKKQWHPNSYMYCTPYHPLYNFKDSPSSYDVIEYPIEDLQEDVMVRSKIKLELGIPADKINILNVGLWTPGKNQGEGVEIARIAEELYPNTFQFHFVGNQAGNFGSYWRPLMENLPSNVTVWGERNDAHLFYQAADAFMFNSTWECNPLAVREAIAHRLPTFARNLPQYLDMFTPYITPFTDDLKENAAILLRELIESGENLGNFIPPTNDIERFRKEMVQHYLETHTAPEVTTTSDTITANITHNRYFKLHVTSLPPGNHIARFIDPTSDKIVYETSIGAGRWYQPSQHWFTPWRVEILNGDNRVWEWQYNTQDNTIGVQFDTSSLGDTLAWMGQIEGFKTHWGWKGVLVKTHKNWLFDTEYYASRGIQIVDQLGDELPTITLGVYYTPEEPWQRAEHRMDWRKIHLGQIASDRLGIPFNEQRPKMAPKFQKWKQLPSRKKPIITFATHSTAGAKYWNHPTGWRELVEGMDNYHWIHCSREGTRLKVEQAESELENVAQLIHASTAFVGISSGLSWFAWALGAKVFLISGFTPEVCEFVDNCVRIINKTSCNSCWSWDVFNKGDWNWCPAHKETERQFECTKTIEPQTVIDIINNNI